MPHPVSPQPAPLGRAPLLRLSAPHGSQAASCVPRLPQACSKADAGDFLEVPLLRTRRGRKEAFLTPSRLKASF